jgi:hypothetical protein
MPTLPGCEKHSLNYNAEGVRSLLSLKTLLLGGEVGHDPCFCGLVQAWSALDPKSFEEKLWVDVVLARKKGLGL